MHLSTLDRYLKQIKEADGVSRINYKLFKKNPRAMALVAQQYNNSKMTKEQLLTELNKIEGIKIGIATLYRYLRKMEEEAGGGTPNFQALASASGNPGSSIPKKASAIQEFSKEDSGGSRKITYKEFKNDPRAMALVEQFNTKQITDTALFEALKRIKPKLSTKSMYFYLNRLNEEKKAGSGVPNLQAIQIAQQSYNFTSGNPGSSTSASNKGKSTNFSKAPGASSHYGGAMLSQQAPPMDGTDVPLPSQTETDSTNWFGDLENDEGSLQSMVNPKNPSSWKKALGSASHYGSAMPSQQAPPTDDTFVPSQAGTDSTNFFGGNSQNDDGSLQSMVNPKNPSLFKNALGSASNYCGAMPFLPNQLQSTGRTSASNFFSPTPNTSNFNSGNPGSSSHYCGAMPFQQAPMPGTSSFPAFPNPLNQSAPLNSSTNFVPSQNETDSLDWFGGNSQNNEGTLESMIRTGKPGSSKNASQGSAPTFVLPQAGTDSTNFGWNSQNNDGDLALVVRPKNTSSWKGFDTAPYFPNQLQSTGRTSASNFFSPTPNTSNFNSGNPGSSSHYGGTMPFQQAPMSGTSFPAFPNQPLNQSAPLNPSTKFVSSQPGTPSLDWSGGNSQNNEGDLYSVVNTRKPSSSTAWPVLFLFCSVLRFQNRTGTGTDLKSLEQEQEQNRNRTGTEQEQNRNRTGTEQEQNRNRTEQEQNRPS
uniref:Uncharacterized protein n=1 Tax=Globodera rostochiensis TaxID=31243 RepID=A0A914GSI2_GLORO